MNNDQIISTEFTCTKCFQKIKHDIYPEDVQLNRYPKIFCPTCHQRNIDKYISTLALKNELIWYR